MISIFTTLKFALSLHFSSNKTTLMPKKAKGSCLALGFMCFRLALLVLK